MNTRHLSAIIAILVMSLSVYFSAGAQAQPSNQGNLTIYHVGPDGQIVAAQNNVFTEGETIWIGVPQGSTTPYLLSVHDQNGATVVTKQGGSFPPDNLLPLSLDPGSYTPNHSYQVILGASQTTLPGMAVVQSHSAVLVVTVGYGHLSSENFSRNNGQVTASVRLSDPQGNSKTGVRLGLFLNQGPTSIPITTEKTNSRGGAGFSFGEALSAGQYQYEVKVLDDGVFAAPLQLPPFTVGTRATSLYTWSSNGNLAAALLDSSNSPVPGRLLLLQHALKDGNWTVDSTTYTDENGRASFPIPADSWRVSFNGDTFYSPSASQAFSSPPQIQTIQTQTAAASSTFVGTTFSNGHITVKISPEGMAIYDPGGVTLLGHMSWEVQIMGHGSWSSMPWDGPLSMSVDDVAGQHRVTLQGTAGNGSLAVSMYLLGKAQDSLFTPLRMPVQLTALSGSRTYRLIWHLVTSTPASFQFEQRTGDQRTRIAGPVTEGSSLVQSPSGENSLVALAPDGKPVLIGLNWDSAMSYYQGARVSATSSGATASIQFGTFALASGQSFIIPACPCPDGGGGGGGTINTTTTLYLPTSSYATITTVLRALAKDTLGNPVYTGTVNFYKDGSLVGGATTNSTGFASLPWTPNTTGSHTINATFIGNGYDLSSSAAQSLTVSQTPTTIVMLKPVTIAYSWDAYSYYGGNGRPIVIPVEALTLAPTNNSGPGNTYVPTYNGNSTTPPHISGYGWAGLNQSAAVTVTFNSTYTQTQTMNWTRNFYMPPCTTPPFCSTTPRTGHMYFTASVAPPSTLYTASSTSLNIPYQNVNTATTATNQLSQTATPPAHIYVNVNATYPYITVSMQGVPVALEAYTAYLAYSLGGSTSSSVQCPNSGCYNYYSIPVLSSSAGSDFAYACTTTACTTPAANVQLNLYNSKGALCLTTTTDNRGIAQLNFIGSKSNCTYPYYYLGTTSTQVVLSELFAIEAYSSPNPFYTNFQGYNYAIYAPHRTGRYLLNMHVWYQQGSSFTVLYPSTSYPDVQQAILTCCDLFLSAEKHPVQVNVGITPGVATIVDNVNGTIVLNDQAKTTVMPNTSLTYALNRLDPNAATVRSGSLTTNSNGNVTLTLGKLSYGNYTLTVNWAGNSTSNAASYKANFTIWKARTIIIISPGWIQQATVSNTYLFTTMLVDNATKSMIAVPGLLEQVYVNGALYSTTELCTTSGCSVANYYLTNPGGNATFPWTPTAAGQYILNATLPRQNYYPSATFAIQVSVSLRPVILLASGSPGQPNTGDTVTWTVQAYDMMNNASLSGLSITQFINGSSFAPVLTNATGYANFTHVFSVNGFYNVTFSSAPTQAYNSATTQSPLKIFIRTSLSLTGGTVYLGQQNSFSLNLKDANNNNLVGRVVEVSINNVFYQNVTTDSNGNGQFTWGPTSLGGFTLVAKFSASGSQDATYRASGATLEANVVVRTIINTDATSGGTQSIQFPTASSSPPPSILPSISISFPSITSIKVAIQFLGSTVTATASAHFTFPWICVASINTLFGNVCILRVPIVIVYVDLSLSGVLDLHLIGQLLGAVNVLYSIPQTISRITPAFRYGVLASSLVAGAGIAMILLGPVGPAAAGAFVDLLQGEAAAVGLLYGWKSLEYISYLLGLMVPPVLGLPCALYASCLPSLPLWLTLIPGQPVPNLPFTVGAWALYEEVGVIPFVRAVIPWTAIELGIAIAIPAILIAMQTQ